MKKLIALFIGLFLVGVTSIQAQDLRVDEITVINSQANNVTVEVKVAEQGQTVANRITQTEVNQKEGFNATINAENTLLTLNFTTPFNERELNTLLEYSGVKLYGKAFGDLYYLINQ